MRHILLLCTAIAAHKPKPPPPPPMAPPTIPLSKPSTRAGATCSRNPKDHGNSRQLGNHINDWYFGYEKGFSAASHHPQTESGAPNCFEAYLLQHLYKDGILQVEAKDRGIETFPSAEDLATLRDAVLSHTSSVASFAIYYPEGIKKILPEFSAALRSHMLTYARDYDPGLLNLTASFGPRHCVVHYRVGDVASQNAKRLPSPQSLAAAVESLKPDSVHILSSGMGHLCPGTKACHSRSREMLHALEADVRKRLPTASVRVEMEERVNAADADFYRMALAPMLVTSSGSFAMAAAIASNGEVRTPACKQMSLCRPQVPPITMRKGWKTFAFDALDPNGTIVSD